MNDLIVEHKLGDASMHDDYIDFINYVFGFNGTTSDFYKLLPKLYKREYNPAASSYVTLENGKIKAAVGAFDTPMSVCGTELKVRGIGNVAVHPFSRSKGYMRTLMDMAINDMIKDGTDISALGGRRQRYNYFSYERGGTTYSFTINSDNLRHSYGKERAVRFEILRVAANDRVLDDIAALFDAQPYHCIRERARLHDILLSGNSTPYAAFEDGVFVGYALVCDKRISEIFTVKESDFLDLAVNIYDYLKMSSMTVTLAEFQQSYIKDAIWLSESYTTSQNEMYSVLNYQKVCDAFMRLKATYASLPNGELVIEVNGKKGREKLLFAVANGVPSVTHTDREAAMTLEHLEAQRFIFAQTCPERLSLPYYARLWFPLPIWIFQADKV